MTDEEKTKEQLLEEVRSLRQRLAAAVSESESRFEAFMDNSPAVGFMKDEAGRYVYVSRNYRRFVGGDPAEVLGKTDFDLWPREVAQRLRDNDCAVLAS